MVKIIAIGGFRPRKIVDEACTYVSFSFFFFFLQGGATETHRVHEGRRWFVWRAIAMQGAHPVSHLMILSCCCYIRQ